uniref:ACT domain-containing protein n=1 Tax=Heterorhabditis bacteriophora TaxID=37862 RepID=A0A1I7XVD0_HETBA
MIASASGSVRTVEAVSSVLLRMFFFDEDPGKAIHSPAAFWDVRDGNFYCENDTDDARNLFDEVRKVHGIECRNISSNDFAANDRITMAVRKKPGRKRAIKAAVDRRSVDFNYAVGY